MINPANSTVVKIDGFIMRSLQPSDLDVLTAIWSEEQVTRFLPSRGAQISRENTEKSLQSFISHWKQRGYGVWAIVEENSAQMVGYCGLRYLDELNEVELFY